MTTLKYNLIPLHNAYVFQVLEQDADFAQAVATYGPFTASNGWKVAVSAEPELDTETKTIYLRGSNSKKDLKVDKTYNIKDNYVRDEVIRQVHAALAEVVSNYKQGSWRAPKAIKGNPLAGRNKSPLERNTYPFFGMPFYGICVTEYTIFD